MKNRLLIIEDDAHILETLTVFFGREGFDVDGAATAEEGIAALRERPGYHLALVDLQLPDMTGIEVVARSRDIAPGMPTVIMTAFGSIPSAIEATKAGAFHYITKPFQLDDVKVVVERAIQYGKLERENDELRQQLKAKYKFENIVGNSQAMDKVFRIIERVAPTDSNVLITGPNGTGKELVAKAIHYNSSRRHKPPVIVNCAAIPEHLLESELFGHKKGAFTGAVADKPGRFQLADGGTIFLDEIGDMSLALQAKLLRVLDQKTFEPVGQVKPVKVDVRVIAATNVDLDAAKRDGKFREDLYYRLHVIPIELPALKQRRDDIDLLIQHFLGRYAKGDAATLDVLTPEALDALRAWDWPGNVRELENLMERLMVLKGEGKIDLQDLPEEIAQRSAHHPTEWSPPATIPTEGISLKDVVNAFEDRLILKALELANGNKNRAAELLKMNRTTLIEKMKRKKLGSFAG